MGNKLSGFLFGLLAAWSISTGSLAEEAEIKGTMQDAAHALSSLMPYIYNDQAFRTLTNKGEIEQNIDKLIIKVIVFQISVLKLIKIKS